jgi:hypothetical protein
MSDEKDIAQAELAALDFKLGLYEHYKGGRYIIFAVSCDEDTLEPLVHYYSIEKKTRWTRTLVNFAENVQAEFDGDFVGPRFAFVREFREPGDVDPAIVVPWRPT